MTINGIISASRWIIVVLWTIIVIFININPDEAMKNLVDWSNYIGLNWIMKTVEQKTLYNWLIGIASTILIVCMIGPLTWRYCVNAKHRKNSLENYSNILNINKDDWRDLEKRFRELERVLQYSRIDGQDGAAGEFWRVAGGPNRDAVERFEAVSAMAGIRLSKDFPMLVKNYPEVLAESDDKIRWYKSLRYILGRFEHGFLAEQKNEDGSSAGFITTGSIMDPASASVTLCTMLISRI